eukprot:gnl/Ergobibamus_cyprinoides/4657.p4 GENE.gnl/Ergobibamus_cyprinoides/4657~~gnl/Ergobibamus_cyprinoides/4657.p4  ORF type:complete len:144 (+),score=53.81 gnl/Ergobibamus_cyprinoides/4657:115-546(+)
MAAPSAVARDPWSFIVVRDAETRAKLADGLLYAKMARDSPVVIVPCGHRDRAHEGAKTDSYMVQDLSAATQNILLAAAALGLGAVWTGVYPNEANVAVCRDVLGIPEDVTPFAAIPIGVPAKPAQPRTRRTGCGADKVHMAKW